MAAPKKATTQTAAAALNAATRSAAAALKTFRDELAAIRHRIHEFKATRDHIAHLPADLVTAEQRIDAWLSDMLKSHGKHSVANLFTRSLERFEKGSSDLYVLSPQKVRYYAFHTIASRLKVECAEALADVETITDADRAAQLAQIDKQISSLEMQEENLVRQAERAGVVAPRRPDASPAALLANDDDISMDQLTPDDRVALEAFTKRHRPAADRHGDDGAIFEMA